MAKNGDQPMFSEEERKEHKKQQLLNSSLGALLSGIGDGDNVDRSSSSTQKTKTAGHDREGETKRAEVADNCGLNKKTSALDFVEMKLEDWTQTRQFNDNYANDIEYLTYERQKLAEKYGEGIIDVNCSQQGTFSYYCKLCFATLNSIIPLKSHCSGMRHLKKKDIHEKSEAQKEKNAAKRKRKSDYPGGHQYYEDRLNDRYQRDDYLRGDSSRERPIHPDERGSRYRDERDSRYHDERRSSHPYDRYSPYRDEGRSSYPYDRYSPYRDEERSSYLDRGRSPYASDRYTRYPEDSYDRYQGDTRAQLRNSRERTYSPVDYFPSERRLTDEHYVRSHTPLSNEKGLPGENLLPYNRSPPLAKPSSPVISTKVTEDSCNLAAEPIASLLLKLAHCKVKNESDAVLASDVIDLMLKALKEYNESIGEKNVAEFMEQAEIKLGTAKAIRRVNKTTSANTSIPDPISVAMETLRRAVNVKTGASSSSQSSLKYF